MDRRDFLRLAGGGASTLAFTSMAPRISAAQDASPVPAPAPALYTAEELGLPELFIRQTDTGFEAPSEVAAGRYLLTVENASSAEAGGAGFIAASEGMTVADVQSQFAAVEEFFAALESGTPPTGDDPTAFLFEALIIGGPATGGTGSIGQAVIDLPAGDYVIWNEDFSSMTGTLTVTGEMPADLAEPEASATVTAVDAEDHFDFTVDGQAVAGKQLIKFHNNSDQPHFMFLVSSPVELTDEQWFQMLSLQDGGTPAPDSGLPSMEEVAEFGGTTSQSKDQVMWWAVDLAPGSYGIFCFIPDPTKGGVPHSLDGMVGSFTVA